VTRYPEVSSRQLDGKRATRGLAAITVREWYVAFLDFIPQRGLRPVGCGLSKAPSSEHDRVSTSASTMFLFGVPTEMNAPDSPAICQTTTPPRLRQRLC
jgi:hypothetical protein